MRRAALPARMLHTIPDSLSLEKAALAEPAAVAWHGVERAGDVRGKRVAVIGSGPIGLLVVAVALHHGAAEVVATDLQVRPREVATSLGARSIDARDEAAIARLAADVVVESSGTVPGLAAAVSACARGGTVVMLGLQRNGAVEAPLATAITRELALVGSFRFAAELDPVIEALADGSSSSTVSSVTCCRRRAPSRRSPWRRMPARPRRCCSPSRRRSHDVPVAAHRDGAEWFGEVVRRRGAGGSTGCRVHRRR